MLWDIVIPIKPVGKARARVTRFGTFTPKKTKDAERLIQSYLGTMLPNKPFSGPLSVTIEFNMIKPKSAPKHRLYPLVRPDLDNYAKAVLDACNKIIWKDDCQIVDLKLYKRYFIRDEILLKVRTL